MAAEQNGRQVELAEDGHVVALADVEPLEGQGVVRASLHAQSGHLPSGTRTRLVDALGKGDLAGAIELTSPEIAERLSVAGTPDECVAKLRSEIADAGVNHLILAITDGALVKALMGRELDNVATVDDQLQLIHDEVMPAFA